MESNTESGSTLNRPPVKKPSKSSFKQQRLPAWQPIITAQTVFLKFLVIGIIFIGVGVALLLLSEAVEEITIPYTDCEETGSSISCSKMLVDNPGKNCSCKVEFHLNTQLKSPVYMYYRLTNFHQNHRLYLKSKDKQQLLGKIGSLGNLNTPAKECKPYHEDHDKKYIIPCGAIANSMFNDTITLQTDAGEDVALNGEGIAWDSDKKHKFKNPPDFTNPGADIWKTFTSPPGWGSRSIWSLENGLENEDFIVWMRPAALPDFKKLYRKIEHSDGLPSGNYSLSVEYRYPVTAFGGTKSIVLISLSPIVGGHNSFLGICYISVGCICFFLGIVFLLMYKRNAHKLSSIGSTSVPPRTASSSNGDIPLYDVQPSDSLIL